MQAIASQVAPALRTFASETKRRWWTRVRDAVTGRFVKRGEAQRRPESTVVERVEGQADSAAENVGHQG